MTVLGGNNVAYLNALLLNSEEGNEQILGQDEVQ